MSITLRVPRGIQTGIAQDPDQRISNAGESDIDRPLTTKNAITYGSAFMYGKRVAQAVGGAAINQIGNAQVERRLNVAKKGVSYAGIGLLTGNVPLAVAGLVVDATIKTVDVIQENVEITRENERKVSERGALTSLGNNYD
jgi:hypothetical protein